MNDKFNTLTVGTQIHGSWLPASSAQVLCFHLCPFSRRSHCRGSSANFTLIILRVLWNFFYNIFIWLPHDLAVLIWIQNPMLVLVKMHGQFHALHILSSLGWWLHEHGMDLEAGRAKKFERFNSYGDMKKQCHPHDTLNQIQCKHLAGFCSFNSLASTAAPPICARQVRFLANQDKGFHDEYLPFFPAVRAAILTGLCHCAYVRFEKFQKPSMWHPIHHLSQTHFFWKTHAFICLYKRVKKWNDDDDALLWILGLTRFDKFLDQCGQSGLQCFQTVLMDNCFSLQTFKFAFRGLVFLRITFRGCG